MKKIKFYLGTDKPGISCEKICEFKDDITKEEVNKAYGDWLWKTLDCAWWEVKNEQEK